MSNSTTKTFGRITQLSLHGKIIHLSLQKKNKKRTLKKIGVNVVMAFTHPQQKKAFNNKKNFDARPGMSRGFINDYIAIDPTLSTYFWMIILTLTVFCCRVLFPGIAMPAPFAKASQSGENNTRRTNTQIKHPNTLIAIFLKENRSSDSNNLALLQDDFRIPKVWV